MTITPREAPQVCFLHEVAEEADDENDEDGNDVLDLPLPHVSTRALRLAYRRREFPESDIRLHLASSRISYVRWLIYLVTGSWVYIRPSSHN